LEAKPVIRLGETALTDRNYVSIYIHLLDGKVHLMVQASALGLSYSRPSCSVLTCTTTPSIQLISHHRRWDHWPPSPWVRCPHHYLRPNHLSHDKAVHGGSCRTVTPSLLPMEIAPFWTLSRIVL